MSYEYGTALPPAYQDALIVPHNQLGTLRDPISIGRVPSAFDVRVTYSELDELRSNFINNFTPVADRVNIGWDDLYDRHSLRSSLRLQQQNREDARRYVVTGLVRHDAEPINGWRLALRLSSYQTKGPEEFTTDAQYDIETREGRVIRAAKHVKVTRSFFQIDERRAGGYGEVRHVRFHEFRRTLIPRHCEYVVEHLDFIRSALEARTRNRG